MSQTLNKEQDMFTITQAQTVDGGFIVKLKHGADGGRLSDQIACRLQFVPDEAFDESSWSLIAEYAEYFDNDVWTIRPTPGRVNEGYYSLVVYGQIEVGPLVTSDINGQMTSWYEGFTHGPLTLSKIGTTARPSGFNPELSKVVAAPAVVAPAPAPAPAAKKTTSRKKATA